MAIARDNSPDRLVSASRAEEEQGFELKLRPRWLREFIGQSKAKEQLAIALEAGVMLAAAYLLTGRLWLSMGIHFAWNFTQGGIFGAAVSGRSATPWPSKEVRPIAP